MIPSMNVCQQMHRYVMGFMEIIAVRSMTGSIVLCL